jgi:hypothetical protein
MRRKRKGFSLVVGQLSGIPGIFSGVGCIIQETPRAWAAVPHWAFLTVPSRAVSFPPPWTLRHLEDLSMDQGISDLSPGCMEIPPGGLPRDSEVNGSLLLFKAVEINEPENLYLIGLEGDGLLPLRKATLGSITPREVSRANMPADAGPAPASNLLLPGIG